MTDWNNFYIAVATASATLTGLIFIGISISLTRILSVRGLPERALVSLTLLLNMLVLSLLFLVPQQSPVGFGLKVLLIGIIVWMVVTYLDRTVLQNKQSQNKQRYLINVLIDQAATLFYVVSGVVMTIGGEGGLHWMVAPVLLSIIKAVIDAWVLMVEINR